MSTEEAFFACTFLEENAQIQLQAEISRVPWIAGRPRFAAKPCHSFRGRKFTVI
jgi:hypothetical protein